MEHLRSPDHYFQIAGFSFNYIGLIVFGVGAFVFWASLTDKEWFWNLGNYRSAALRKAIGHSAYRYFCIAVGAALLLAGLVMTISLPVIIQPNS
jgi:hypothetical protein